MSSFQKIDNIVSKAKIIPDAEGFLIRVSKPFASGQFKGETKRFIVVELTVIPKKLKTDDGEELRIGFQQSERIVTTIWEHRNRLDFNDIVENDLEKMGLFDDEAGDYVTTDKLANGEYKLVPIKWAAEGAFYRLPCPTYKDAGGTDRNSVSFYLPKTANTSDESVMNHYRRACEAVGSKIADDFADTAKTDNEIVNKEADKPVEPTRQTRRK